MRPYRLEFLALAAVALASTSADPAAARVDGLWVASDGAIVRITSCGGAICGYVSNRPTGDGDNGNLGGRDRTRELQVLNSMRPSGPGRWTGQLYNPKDGNTYTGNLIELGPDAIRIEGCVLVLCGGENLTRAQ
jgi:uncharacterized protein (DUF2147 family)